MKKITEYAIVTGTSHNNLIENVTKALSTGWQPWGDLFIESAIGVTSGKKYCQPMVKYE